MTNEEKILELLMTLQKDITEVKEDIAELKEGQAEVKEDIAELKEGQAELRSGVNTLLDWAERTGNSIDFPLPKIM